jgi:hypothetical protein
VVTAAAQLPGEACKHPRPAAPMPRTQNAGTTGRHLRRHHR